MVKIGLQVKAQLENITNLAPTGEDFRWYLKLKCMACGEEAPQFVFLSLLENQPLKGGRGHASMVVKCKLCSRENSIDIISQSISSYNEENSNTFKKIVEFDCRGVEPVAFEPRIGWSAQGAETGSPFLEIDLTQGEWADYDEKASNSVGVYEIEHKFMKV